MGLFFVSKHSFISFYESMFVTCESRELGYKPKSVKVINPLLSGQDETSLLLSCFHHPSIAHSLPTKRAMLPL